MQSRQAAKKDKKSKEKKEESRAFLIPWLCLSLRLGGFA
jgi:hypothetical protein